MKLTIIALAGGEIPEDEPLFLLRATQAGFERPVAVSWLCLYGAGCSPKRCFLFNQSQTEFFLTAEPQYEFYKPVDSQASINCAHFCSHPSHSSVVRSRARHDSKVA